ncbi:MAG: helix-turn-helix domain-containing protein [Nitrospirae bacterium]|nr:helix-turn-helix domain-containing protein [Nitrospirota bacterium]
MPLQSHSTQSAKNELLTAEETCRYLKIAQRTLYRYIQDRHMPAFKLGKEWRFVRSDLEQWLRQRAAVRPRRRSARR